MRLSFFTSSLGLLACQVGSASAANSTGNALIDELVAKFQAAVPTPSQQGLTLLSELLSPLTNRSYSIPQNSGDPKTRSRNVDTVRANFVYGAPVAGGPFYPNGSLGIAKDVFDVGDIQSDLNPEIGLAVQDINQAASDASKYNGLKTLNDYTRLYDGEWLHTLPNGPDPGVETNYTQDLLFSMQRLSASPYQVRRLAPTATLAFTISDTVAKSISGLTLKQLQQQGRLFYADYRDQKNLEPTDRFAAASDAYFYINPQSGDFLPLAIRSNRGNGLIYTPLDSPNDWLLAKIMYNVDDFWFAQWNHLAGTHQVLQIVWMAAVRTLNQEHPVFALLNRLTKQVFAIQLLAESILFGEDGAVDLVFAYTGPSAQNYTTAQYQNGAGRFQSNYFETNLRNRGLLGATPALKHFPFYEDGKVIHDAIWGFMTAFVKSYYPNDAVLVADAEIQAWVAECNGAAKVLDFPAKITTAAALVDVLTHAAHLASTAHHAVNTNELLQVSSTLPFCPPSLYSAPPTAKSTSTDPVAFLPTLEKVIEQFTVGSLFARPLLAGTNRTIIHMFDDQDMLSRMNPGTQLANKAFVAAMTQFSGQVSKRTFDAQGLSQGMPFVWKALDPNVAPYSLAT